MKMIIIVDMNNQQVWGFKARYNEEAKAFFKEVRERYIITGQGKEKADKVFATVVFVDV